MTIFFTWVKKEEDFNPKIHKPADFQLLSVILTQSENGKAIAKLKIVDKGLEWPENCLGFVCYEIQGKVHNLLCGEVSKSPKMIGNGIAEIEMKSFIENEAAQMAELGSRLKKAPYWDELFVSPQRRGVSAEWLDARSSFLHWNRVSGKLGLSDIFTGAETLDLSGDVVGDYALGVSEMPYSQVDVHLSAEWIQHLEGLFDLTSLVAGKFKGGIINSLTGGELVRRWPKEGQTLGRSGYQVVESYIREIDPPYTGILDLYPTVTPGFSTYDSSSEKTRTIRARRKWYKGSLTIGWRYSQKRSEEVLFSLKNAGVSGEKVKKVDLRLGDITSKNSAQVSRSTFFNTDRGRQTIEHAIEIAKSHLAMSARCVETEVKVPLEKALGITLDHCVTINHPHDEAKKIKGKVSGYQLFASGYEAYALIKIAFSLGGVTQAPVISSLETIYGVDTYGEINAPAVYVSPSRIAYQMPLECDGNGVDQSVFKGASDFIEDIGVHNQATDQERYLEENQYPVREDIKAVLRDVPTDLHIRLKDIRTSDVLTRKIPLKLLSDWVAPQQIKIEED